MFVIFEDENWRNNILYSLGFLYNLGLSQD